MADTATSEQSIVEALATRVMDSRHFGAHQGRNGKRSGLLRSLVEVYGKHELLQERLRTVGPGPRHDLKVHLENCFLKDRSLWGDPEQRTLVLNPGSGLELGKISDTILDPVTRFWFHQAAHAGLSAGHSSQTRPAQSREDARAWVTFSEPLFFYSQRLNTYIRSLDLDYDHEEEIEKREADLQKRLCEGYAAKLRDSNCTEEQIEDFMKILAPVPVRHYVPAGDAYAASTVRKWFRDNQESLDLPVPLRKESRRISGAELPLHNLIVISSRTTNKEAMFVIEMANRDLAESTTEHQRLAAELVPSGLRFDGRLLPDIQGRHGAEQTHVLVTNWVTSHGKAYSLIASNHSRAVGEVARLIQLGLVDPIQEKIRERTLPSGKTAVKEKFIPARVQIAFDLSIPYNEVIADPPRLVPGFPIYYS